jgi:NitT/TauT family transport system permease protein
MTADNTLAPHFAAAPRRRVGSAAPAVPTLRQLRPVILPLATAAAVLIVWQVIVVALRIPAVILPTPPEIAHELWRGLPILLHHAVPTTLEALVAFFAASALGVGLAVAITYSPLLRDMLYPNLVVFQLIPKIALVPLFVVWLGISSESRVTFATFVSFFPVVISAAVGFAGTDASTLRLCRSLTASEWQSFAMVRFPFALPAIFSGMKISAKAGLGFYILYASSRMETAVVFAALFVLCVIGVGLFGAVALAEELVRRVYGRR